MGKAKAVRPSATDRQSDNCIVPTKVSNKAAGEAGAERLEGRRLVRGKSELGHWYRTQMPGDASQHTSALDSHVLAQSGCLTRDKSRMRESRSSGSVGGDGP